MKINSKLRLSLVSLIVLGNIISTFYTRISPKKTLRKEKTVFNLFKRIRKVLIIQKHQVAQ